MLQLPVFGREEDAADQMAAYLYLQLDPAESRRLITGTVYAYTYEAIQGELPSSLEEIAEADDPEAATDRRIEEYREKFAHPYIAASRGYLDDVIDPRETRPRLISALDMLANKRDENPLKKHGNIPL